MRSAAERSREYRNIVSVGIAASVAIHAAVLGLGRVHVDIPGGPTVKVRETRLVEPARALQVVTLAPEIVVEPIPPVEAREVTASAPAAVGPGEAAPTESFATVASDAADMDAAPAEPAAIDLSRATPARSLPADMAIPGRVVADVDVHATIPDAPTGTGEDDEEEEGGSGLKGIIDGIGGFLGGIKVNGGIGGGDGSGGKGGCVPGIGGIVGGRKGGHSIPQRPAVGPRGIGGAGPRFEHHSGSRGAERACGQSR